MEGGGVSGGVAAVWTRRGLADSGRPTGWKGMQVAGALPLNVRPGAVSRICLRVGVSKFLVPP